jgi:hypothetical protein
MCHGIFYYVLYVVVTPVGDQGGQLIALLILGQMLMSYVFEYALMFVHVFIIQLFRSFVNWSKYTYEKTLANTLGRPVTGLCNCTVKLYTQFLGRQSKCPNSGH